MIDQDIKKRLTDEVGCLVGNRIWAIQSGINPTLPAIVYAAKLGDSVWTNRGPTGTYEFDLTVIVNAITFPDCENLMAATLLALDGFHGANVMICRHKSSDPSPTEPNGFAYTMEFAGKAHIDADDILTEAGDYLEGENGYNLEEDE